MNYEEIDEVSILGIGGKGAFYIAKFLLLCGIKVIGYDLKESENTQILEKLGAEIKYRNPEVGEKLRGDFYIFSNDLPQKLQQQVFTDNKEISNYEVGHFYHQIIENYENNSMSNVVRDAFVKSEIAPLFQIDQSKMKYIAVTGTDGKTSTCTMIYHILKGAGFKPALITTVNILIGDESVTTGFLHTTTPSSQEIFKIIKMAEEKDCTHMIIEATSHGLEQGRLAGLKFDEVGYTNITSEHLDYHKTWENYCHAKSLLITEHLKESGDVVLNIDDKSFKCLEPLCKHFVSYSREQNADLVSESVSEEKDSLIFKLKYKGEDYSVMLPLIGEYNVSNFMCASLLLVSEGISIKDSIQYIRTFHSVEGRMQVIQEKPFKVIVDYAHTPNALKEVLSSLRKNTKNGKIIHVFGTAGHRDFYKRPVMGKISNEYSNITILTAEDPRLESLSEINDQIAKGWYEGGFTKHMLIRFDDVSNNVENRRSAIKRALELANPNDTVIITGKAHEKSLCFGQIEYRWNDIEEVKRLLKSSN